MALLFVDGFDHYATADLEKKWSVYNSATIEAVGRRGSGALKTNTGSGAGATKNLASTYSTLILGAALKIATFSGEHFFLALNEGGTAQIHFVASSDGVVSVWRGGTRLGQSLPGVVPINAWFYFEAKAVINNTTGAAEVRINGSTVIALTNVDTQSTANAYTTAIQWLGALSQPSVTIDDLYLLDTSGTVNNDFLGDCRVDAYLPTVDGALSDWTPNPVGVHYTTVDEATPNATDYISSATVGNKDTFGVPDMINTPLSIFGVQLAAFAWKTDAGFREIKNLVRVSAVDYPSSALSVTETSTYKLKVWEQNPATSAAWSVAAVNAAEWGVEVA